MPFGDIKAYLLALLILFFFFVLQICVKISHWDVYDLLPIVKFLSTLGSIGQIGPETKALLHTCQISDNPFPPQALNCLDSLSDFQISPTILNERRDLRNERIFTIDPVTAKDLDDALHIKQLPSGNLEVGVHIADVSHFLTPGSALDQEAQKRTTSTYLVVRSLFLFLIYSGQFITHTAF